MSLAHIHKEYTLSYPNNITIFLWQVYERLFQFFLYVKYLITSSKTYVTVTVFHRTPSTTNINTWVNTYNTKLKEQLNVLAIWFAKQCLQVIIALDINNVNHRATTQTRALCPIFLVSQQTASWKNPFSPTQKVWGSHKRFENHFEPGNHENDTKSLRKCHLPAIIYIDKLKRCNYHHLRVPKMSFWAGSRLALIHYYRFSE